MIGRVNNNIQKNIHDNLCIECITILIEAYKFAVNDYVYNYEWEEDDFTALLVDEYMEKVPLKYQKQWFIAPQRPLYSKVHLSGDEHAKKAPRPDIRFEKYVLSNPIPFKYTIESKKLKCRSSHLKRRYIETGIANFKTKRYSFGCLAGYMLNSESIDCVNGINKLLIKDGREKETLASFNIIEDFENSYKSKHNQDFENIELWHLFLEF